VSGVFSLAVCPVCMRPVDCFTATEQDHTQGDGRRIGLYMRLSLPILFSVWRRKGCLGRGRSLRNGRAIVLQ